MAPLRLAFMGTPEFAVPALRAIHEAGHEIACVYTQPPRPKGRGRKIQESPVHAYALAHGMPVRHPASLRDQEAWDDFQNLKLDVAVVAAYGLILPKAILFAPKYGCINIHASLLPRWRGASPIQRSIWEGDAESGITLMQMDEGLDTGAMIAKRALAITSETTSSALHDRLAALGGDMILQSLSELVQKGFLNSEQQSSDGATYAPLLKKEDGRIEWSQDAEQIGRQIRALNPWPGVWSHAQGRTFKIQEAQILSEKTSAAPGTILNMQGDVACGRAILRILKIQPESARAMDFAAVINGHHLKVGDRFS